jgi:glycosyltransferase involved in cell wall biosynthesis
LDVGLTVAGAGPDRERLERACSARAHRIIFLGRVSPDAVPAILADHDVFLAPSRFEGFGCSIIEAMASGCVPIASHIRAVTDTIVRDGETGFLFPVGDVRAAAAAVRRLALNRATLQRMSDAARADARERFSVEAMAESYAAILSSIRKSPKSISKPFPLHQWRYPAGLKPSLRTYLPTGLKNMVRGWRERLA